MKRAKRARRVRPWFPENVEQEDFVVAAMVHNMETGHETSVGKDGWKCKACKPGVIGGGEAV